MLEILLVLALSIFAALGMADAADALVRLCGKSRQKCRAAVVLPVDGTAQDVEMRVRGLLAERYWEEMEMPYRVFLVDCKAGEDVKKVCARLALQWDNVSFCTPEELCGEVGDFTLERLPAN